jgi:hypothetical protein
MRESNMTTSHDLRRFERIPCSYKIEILSKGRMVAYAMAINIGMGGMLVAAPLPVGSQCQIAVPDGAGTHPFLVDGTVVRSDAGGAAVKFTKTLEATSFDTLIHQSPGNPLGALFASYRAYFRVSRNKDLADCESLLGISKQAFRATFYTTFASCILLAILPVWLFRGLLPAAPNWLKIILSFGYGSIWLAIIQPAMDLTVFHILRRRQTARTHA